MSFFDKKEEQIPGERKEVNKKRTKGKKRNKKRKNNKEISERRRAVERINKEKKEGTWKSWVRMTITK